MWNKSAEAKPSPQASVAAVPVIPEPEVTPLQTRPPSAPAAAPTPAAYTVPKADAANSLTTISAGLKINGEISGNSDLYIDGETQGKIRLANARVTVGPNGRVQADIEAREIIIEGSVQGNLKAGERVQLGAQSKVQGSVLTPRFAIEDGARLRGKVEMIRAGSQGSASAESATDSSKAKVMSASSKDE